MTSNMNFGPEWMRSSLTLRSNIIDSTSSTPSALSPTLNSSLFSANESEVGFTPIKYSKEFTPSLYRPTDTPHQIERLPFVAVDESVRPLIFTDLAVGEKKLLSGSVHADSTGQQRYHRTTGENDSNRPMNETRGREGNDQTNDNNTISGPDGWNGSTLNTNKLPSQYKWFYRDPSGMVQGPFSAHEMHDWHKAGFFGPTLWLRREDQEQFEQLAALGLKMDNEDIFMSPIKNDRVAGMSSFRPTLDPFGQVSGSFSSSGLGSPGGVFGNSGLAADILSSGLGNFSPFGNPLDPGAGSNPGTPSLRLASPLTNNDTNMFNTSLLGRESESSWNDRPAIPSWLNTTQSDLFKGTFQRQPPSQQQQLQQPMINPLVQQFDGMRGFGVDTMNHQQQFTHILQQRQQVNPFFQLPQDPDRQHGMGQRQVLGQLSNHASPVIRPAMTLSNSEWGSAPGTPLATEPLTGPWGSIVSPAIPQNVLEELQAKVPHQKSPRTQLSPQLQPSLLPSVTSTKITAPTTAPPDTHVKITTIIHKQEQPTSTSVEIISNSFSNISLQAIQGDQHKRNEEILKWQLEKEKTHQRQESTLSPKKLETQQRNSVTPTIPSQLPMTRPVSLREIQAEELKKQQLATEQAKAINKMATTVVFQHSTTTKLDWITNGWANEVYKGPSLRKIQDLEAKDAQLKKEMEQRSPDNQQQQYYSSPTVASNSTLSWGIVAPSTATTATTTTISSSSPAWGSAGAPKKTLREIQQEEQVAMQKKTLKQQQKQQQALTNKNGYSIVASISADKDSWATVQSKQASTAYTPISRSNNNNSGRVNTITVNQPPPATTTARPIATAQQYKPDDVKIPSELFKMWCKQSLRDLNAGVNVDEILTMLLSFPDDNSVSEIIQDIIYANSTLMDGRRFAAEFLKRRRADMTTNASSIIPVDSFDNDGFHLVNKKGKKVKST